MEYVIREIAAVTIMMIIIVFSVLFIDIYTCPSIIVHQKSTQL